MPDVDLLLWNKVKSGDDASYEILFRRYYPGLCLFAQKYTNDMVTAREVVQDLFIDLWEFRNDLSVTRSFKSYLFTAVKFNSIRRMQNDKKLWTSMDILPEPEDAQFTDLLEMADELAGAAQSGYQALTPTLAALQAGVPNIILEKPLATSACLGSGSPGGGRRRSEKPGIHTVGNHGEMIGRNSATAASSSADTRLAAASLAAIVALTPTSAVRSLIGPTPQ